jgi:hypothetical protein
MGARGYRRCTMSLTPEQADVARQVLAAHGCVEPASVRYSGQHLSWSIDLASLPDGDGPAVELVIVRAIERAVRP